jgi:hypothetical protein
VNDINAMREAIATNLSTITGLRASAEIPDNPTPPIAVINLDTIDYNEAFNGGLTRYNFLVTVIVGRAAERTMQRKLDAYVQPTGTQSVKVAIESERTLGGEAYDLRVERSNVVGSITINDQIYLAAEFTVTVFA